VRFRDYGAEAIEVVDNGSGIAPENYAGVGELRPRVAWQPRC
jgi:DNA mismatch repair ATPase MutL